MQAAAARVTARPLCCQSIPIDSPVVRGPVLPVWARALAHQDSMQNSNVARSASEGCKGLGRSCRRAQSLNLNAEVWSAQTGVTGSMQASRHLMPAKVGRRGPVFALACGVLDVTARQSVLLRMQWNRLHKRMGVRHAARQHRQV